MENMADNEVDFKTEVTVEEVRNGLGELVNRAAFGKERITITRWGKPIAAIVGLADLAKLESAA